MGISAFCGYLEKCLIRGHNIFMQWKWNNYRYSQVYQAYATNTMMNTRNGTLLQILVLIITFKSCSSHRDNNFLSTIVAGRRLQKPNVTTVYYRTDVPSMSPSRDVRSVGLVVCTASEPEVVSLSTDVEYYLRVETDMSGIIPMDAISWVSGEAIQILSLDVCGSSNETFGQPCVLSISSGTPDTRIISCTPEVSTSKSCAWYRGSIRFHHKSSCSSELIIGEVMTTLTNMTTSDILEKTNLGLSITVTDIEFADAPSSKTAITAKSSEQSRNQLSSGGIFLSVFIGIVVLSMFLLTLTVRRRRKNIRTAAFTPTEFPIHGRKYEKKTDYIEPNWRDLGSRHSSMDCHQCNSLMCTTCHTHKNDVQMLHFDKNFWNNDLNQICVFSENNINDDDVPMEEPVFISSDRKQNVMKNHKEDGARIPIDNFEVAFVSEDVLLKHCKDDKYKSVIL